MRIPGFLVSSSIHVVVRGLVVLACASLLMACGPPPRPPGLDQPAVERSLPSGGALADALRPQIEAHPGLSGIYALADGRDAFAARVALARAAQHALDVQYYIWRPDMTGALMFEALLEAASRGVRVRLLLDDNNGRDIDVWLAELDSHPNIEVRLFNPFVLRAARVLNFLTDFDRLNRRMHNKSFTVDAQATIVGGRNIADAYFDAAPDILFADLDVLAVGPVVVDVARDFDRYWKSESAYPASIVLPETLVEGGTASLAQRILKVREDPEAQQYLQVVAGSKLLFDLREGALPLDWAPVEMVSDDPAKGLGMAEPEALLPNQLNEIIGEPQHDVELVSPYFIPTEAGVAAFADLVKKGVRVRVLTNSLEATDISVAHAGYSKYRQPLLRAGVELFETRLQSRPDSRHGGALGLSGSSGSSSLHAKTFAVDGERVFVGSFNFDPRSVNYNTEMGFVIHSRELAYQIDQAFDIAVPQRAYRLLLDEDGRLIWEKREDEGEGVRRFTSEPGTSIWRRIWVQFLSWLPIEGFL
ncbi:MAG: phospholipase D family protein [Pigmentiphaga sp.]